MRNVQQLIYSACVGWIAMWLTACGEEAWTVSEEEGTAVATFHVTTRADEGDATPRFTRLLLAERFSEHFDQSLSEALYCDLSNRYDLTGGTYSVRGLYGQWYKFAFVDVPAIDETMGATLFAQNADNHDFNQLLVDYGPVMDYQKNNLIRAQQEDMAIYRKIIDRWVDESTELVENVQLTRVTGELVMDMGIPADQFEHQVASVKVYLNGEQRQLYIRDNARDEVMTEPSDSEQSFVWTIGEDEQNSRQQFHIALLPGELTNATVTVDFVDSGVAYTYDLQNEAKKPIVIKKNTRTVVRFNGLNHKEHEFEIRYAGFDDDAVVDVDDDAWDGWN